MIGLLLAVMMGMCMRLVGDRQEWFYENSSDRGWCGRYFYVR